jgi:hypothetical protein
VGSCTSIVGRQMNGLTQETDVPLDMFKLLQEQMESDLDERRRGSTHSALPMWSLDEKRCRSALEAFKSHAAMPTFLAQGVLLALESWNRSKPVGSPPSPSTSAAGTSHSHSIASLPETQVPPTMIYPAVFGSPNLHAQRWLNWKIEWQGREKDGGSAYSSLQISRKADRQVGLRRADTSESALTSASDAETAVLNPYEMNETEL